MDTTTPIDPSDYFEAHNGLVNTILGLAALLDFAATPGLSESNTVRATLLLDEGADPALIRMLYEGLPSSRRRSAVAAQTNNIDGIPYFTQSVSGQRGYAGRVMASEERLFTTFEWRFQRAFDAEPHLLEALADDIAGVSNPSGDVFMVVSYPPCPSCRQVINQFRETFPSVNLTVRWPSH